jgi:spore maturation protein CgeB
MKILLIGPKWMGGWIEGVEHPLCKLGHEVILFNYDTPNAPTIARNKIKISSYSPSFLHSFLMPTASKAGSVWEKNMNENLISLAHKVKADLIFILKGETLQAETLAAIKSPNNCIISWWLDDPISYFHSHPQIRYQLDYIDILFMFDRGRLQELKQFGAKKVEHLPCAFDPMVYHPKQISKADIKKYQCDIGMIASYYSKRGQLLNHIHRLNVGIWGMGWKNKPEINAFPSGTLRGKTLNGHQIATAYNIIKICPNVHHSQTILGGLNMRAFEIPAAQGFQLMDEIQGAEELFEPNTELVMYQSPEHFRELAKYYLKHESERKAIARRSYERAIRDHTYEQRLKKVFEVLDL